MSGPEQKIQSKIIKYLESIGAYIVKVIKATKAGVPDIIACLNGRFIALEVKTPKGRPSELQLYNIEKIQKAGGIAGVVRSVEDVKTLIKDSFTTAT